MFNKVDLGVEFCGVKFKNPFMLSAAPPSDNLDMIRHAFEAGWAGAVLKTTTVSRIPVNLTYPMIFGQNYHDKKISSLGNIDLISEHNIDEVEIRVEKLKKEFPEHITAVSIMGEKKEDWEELVKRLEDHGVDIIECSFSCPQGSLGKKPGAMLAQDPELVERVASWVKNASKNTPVVIKITPAVSDIVEIAEAVKRSGADAICASNTIPSLMGIDLVDLTPNPAVNGKSTYSGLSGPAIKPISLKIISEISKNTGMPITGTGGVETWIDALEFILCGASTIQLCTAVMHYGFDIIEDLCEGLSYYMHDKGFKSIPEITGLSLPYIVSHDELDRMYHLRSLVDPNKCVNCGLCYIACRDGGHGAMNLTFSRKAETNNDMCVGCGLCAQLCPSDAIKIIEIEEAS